MNVELEQRLQTLMRCCRLQGQRDAYLVSFFSVMLSWLVIIGFGWHYSGISAGSGLLFLAYMSHRDLRRT